MTIRIESQARIVHASILATKGEFNSIELDASRLTYGEIGISWDLLAAQDGADIQLIYIGQGNERITAEAIIDNRNQIEEFNLSRNHLTYVLSVTCVAIILIFIINSLLSPRQDSMDLSSLRRRMLATFSIGCCAITTIYWTKGLSGAPSFKPAGVEGDIGERVAATSSGLYRFPQHTIWPRELTGQLYIESRSDGPPPLFEGRLEIPQGTIRIELSDRIVKEARLTREELLYASPYVRTKIDAMPNDKSIFFDRITAYNIICIERCSEPSCLDARRCAEDNSK